MSELVWITEPDATAAGARAAERFAELASASLAARGRFAVALAGGSSPTTMHAALAAWNKTPEIKWPSIDVFFGDERAAATDALASNYRAARESLLSRVSVDPARVRAMEAWRPDLDHAARDYERALREVCAPDGALDLCIIGVGEDAHILSLYPGCPMIDHDEGRLVVALERPPMNPALDRLTLTPTALFAARAILVLLLGDKKRAAFKALAAPEGDERATPVRLVRRARGPVWVIADRAATA
jgi:6-phosphogluconolactonase